MQKEKLHILFSQVLCNMKKNGYTVIPVLALFTYILGACNISFPWNLLNNIQALWLLYVISFAFFVYIETKIIIPIYFKIRETIFSNIYKISR